ncbi:MAG: phosphoglucosamine mutase [Pseudomonadota bacterium]
MSAPQRKFFGTDGIRGRVGEHPITPDFVMKLGWAAGRVLGRNSQDLTKVLIGKDTRVSGYMFESALEAGLAAAGIDIHLLGPMPTPGIAYLTRTFHAQAGIVISASHNLYDDNGIKFFSGEGGKLPDDTEAAIEAEMELPMKTQASRSLGKAHRVTDAAGRYIEFCKSTVRSDIDLKGLRVVVDCAHGATYHIAPAVLSELGADVVAIGDDPNGFNINDACGATAPDVLVETVKRQKADLGIALDGDGDRLMMVDGAGEVLDGDDITLLIARYRQQRGLLDGGVVGTQMSNLGLELAVQSLGLGFQRAKVGDRYILEMLRETGWRLGGETSGHIICLDLTTTGDGMISALQVLEALSESGRSLSDLRGEMTKYPQVLLNVKMARKVDVLSLPAVKLAVEKAEADLGSAGRILLRPSGTEPVLRVMVEGRDQDHVQQLAEHLAEVVEQAVPSEEAA